jgi:hypothetical protein
MTRQQSNSDLAGSLAATLTPRLPPASARALRASQNSGLFDVGALYAQAFQQVAHRARTDPRLAMPLARAAQATWPASARWPQPALSYPFEPEPSFEYPDVGALPSRGLGWFGVAVAWLATVTMGALIATTLPAHAPTHVRALLVVTAPVAPLIASAPPPAPEPPVPPELVPQAIPVAALSAVPPAVTPSPAVRLAPRRLVTPKVAAPEREMREVRGNVASTAAPRVHPAPLAPVAASAAPVTTPRATASSRPAPVAPASTAGMSLDELIRHEVQAESAKHR